MEPTQAGLWYTQMPPEHPEKKSMQFTGVERTSQESGAGGWMFADLSTITATTINDLRKAVAVQQYYEALARGGSRYREQVQALWDVVISDKPYRFRNTLAVADTTSISIKSCRQADSKATQTHLLVKLVQCQ